ncbi:MAG TPA: response regulator [Spirochaetota bacterium]|nr:response regulator [Spirochaetota bacterium]
MRITLENDIKISDQIYNDFKKILIVEDLTYVIKTLERILVDAGYFVLTAKDGEEAIRKFKNYAPHLITVDHKLPDMTGVQLVEEIRKFDKETNPKIIFITGYDDVETVRAIAKLKIDDYLVKPFQKNKLLDTIKKTLEK